MLAAANFTAVSRREIESVKESLSRGYSEIVKKNRKILLAILDVVIVLAKRGIAFRGNWDSAAMKENGNFEFFIKWLAKYDESLSEYLSTAAKNARYLSPQIQNEMINCFGESIRNALVTDIRKSKCIDDRTTGGLYTVHEASSDDEVSVNEVFLGFVELPTTDARTITDSLLGNVSKWGLDTERLRGMGFDGASNMSGTQSGVQARITQRYPKAKYFTHCSSHCLNLVNIASCNKVQEIKNFMTTFQELSFFFSYSPKRKKILKQNFSTSSDAEDFLADSPKEEHKERLFKSALNRESLPTLCDTRWLSRVDSISTLLANYSKIYEAVAQVKAQSKGNTRPLSVLLQSKTCDLVKAHTEARNLKFRKLYARAVKVAQTIEVLPSKPRTTVRQMHRANAPAESIPDFYRSELELRLVYFLCSRLNYYYPFLDHVIQHMNDRFPEALKGALQGTLLIPSNLRKLSTSVEEAIKKEFAEDLPMPQSFEHEVIRWEFAQQDNDSITSLAESVASCDERLYPNISTIFQLLLTLPVGSCSCERTFSALAPKVENMVSFIDGLQQAEWSCISLCTQRNPCRAARGSTALG
ncbi:52 kDa repressor of the inhibitor of the protein kinase [Acropora cervicornis]|uniref:52 kDa repressor of the inhibitor of the protein kinase n=1 Tax=Acropora cervicornis TaxID=6130 RepID=A0AAD9USG3_ACRCE|nr:52 kDa repressor of the inhibitor of the protein kinase [Acropora cervicornis]